MESAKRQHIASVALLVREYDEAIRFFVDKLGFSLIEDTRLDEQKRWVLVAPAGARETRLLLAKADNDQQRACIGNQTGGRVFLILFTDNFARDYEGYRSRGVRFCEEPRHEPYGVVAVFEDLYGNVWDLLEPAATR